MTIHGSRTRTQISLRLHRCVTLRSVEQHKWSQLGRRLTKSVLSLAVHVALLTFAHLARSATQPTPSTCELRSSCAVTHICWCEAVHTIVSVWCRVQRSMMQACLEAAASAAPSNAQIALGGEQPVPKVFKLPPNEGWRLLVLQHASRISTAKTRCIHIRALSVCYASALQTVAPMTWDTVGKDAPVRLASAHASRRCRRVQIAWRRANCMASRNCAGEQVGMVSLWQAIPCDAKVWALTMRLHFWAGFGMAPCTCSSCKRIVERYVEDVITLQCDALPARPGESAMKHQVRKNRERVR